MDKKTVEIYKNDKFLCPGCGKNSGVKFGQHGIETHKCISCGEYYGVMYIVGFNDGLDAAGLKKFKK